MELCELFFLAAIVISTSTSVLEIAIFDLATGTSSWKTGRWSLSLAHHRSSSPGLCRSPGPAQPSLVWLYVVETWKSLCHNFELLKPREPVGTIIIPPVTTVTPSHIWTARIAPTSVVAATTA